MRTLLTSILLPIVLGVSSAMLVTRSMTPTDQQSERQPQEFVVARTGESTDPRIQALERRLRLLEVAGEQTSGQARSIGPDRHEVSANSFEQNETKVEESALPKREDMLESEREWREGLEQRFDEEPIDSAWATDAEADYESGLEDMSGQGGFELRTLECRSSRCRAVLGRPESGSLQMDKLQEAVLGYEFAHNCQTSVYTVPADEGGVSNEVFVHWEC